MQIAAFFFLLFCLRGSPLACSVLLSGGSEVCFSWPKKKWSRNDSE